MDFNNGFNKKSTPSQSEVLLSRNFYAHILHQDEIPCKLRVTDLENFDLFQGVRSINKRTVWFYLWHAGTGSFVTKASIAKDLRLSQSVVGRCLYSLKMDGIVDYQYFTGQGYYITKVMKIDYSNFDVQPSCPFGFKDCDSCLFRNGRCSVGESWRTAE